MFESAPTGGGRGGDINAAAATLLLLLQLLLRRWCMLLWALAAINAWLSRVD